MNTQYAVETLRNSAKGWQCSGWARWCSARLSNSRTPHCSACIALLRFHAAHLCIRKLNETRYCPSAVPVPQPLQEGKNNSAIPESWLVCGLSIEVLGSGFTVH